MSRARNTAETVDTRFDGSDWENSDASSVESDDEVSPLDIPQNDVLDRAADFQFVESETEEDNEQTSNSTSCSNSRTPFNHVPFQEPVGPAILLDSTATALDFFNLTFGNDVMDLLVQQTNIYASHNPPHERYKWQDTTIDEMYLFLGIVIAMGVHRLPFYTDYWSSDCLLGVPGITKGMPLDRFKVLLRCLHLNDNTTAVPRGEDGYNRLHKLRPMIDQLRHTWKTIYHPPREVAIDEAMIGFKGRHVMKQYMPMKPQKRGYKAWARCCSNGFMSDCDIYCGAQGQSTETNLSSAVVLHLAQPLFGKGHFVFYDNYFSSVELRKELLRHNTYSCGTARPNLKQYPAVLKDVLLERGQHKSQVLDGVECFVWKDKKNIHFIQNVCQPDEMDQVMRRNKDGSRSAVPCPLSVKLYNHKMGGVDLADSKRKVYSCSMKSKKWWHPLLYFFLTWVW
jgi:hypothetical protein